MAKDKLFKNGRDREDFFIALAVLALFGYILFGRGLLKNPIKQTKTVAAVEQDSDGDGIPDSKDVCIHQYAKTITGCPKNVQVETIEEEPIRLKEAALAGGGVAVLADDCKKECKTAEECAKKCKKGDSKQCNQPCGKKDEKACQKKKENCKNPCCKKKGAVVAGKDSDNDGIIDENDKCPFTEGVPSNNGCPADTDGDGIPDSKDRCPAIKGLKSNDGCPELKLEEADQKIISEAIKNVQFETASARLKTSSTKVLDKVAMLMNKYPKANLKIEGHTDSEGDDDKNMNLSSSRAESCRVYLVKSGIDTRRIATKGYGETKPIATNDTASGRRQNRRVEFDLNY